MKAGWSHIPATVVMTFAWLQYAHLVPGTEPAEPVDQRGEARRALDASLDELRRTVSRAPVNGSANGHSSRGGTNGAHRGSSPFGAATVAAADNPFL